jgi:hypothetical protein
VLIALSGSTLIALLLTIDFFSLAAFASSVISKAALIVDYG